MVNDLLLQQVMGMREFIREGCRDTVAELRTIYEGRGVYKNGSRAACLKAAAILGIPKEEVGEKIILWSIELVNIIYDFDANGETLGGSYTFEGMQAALRKRMPLNSPDERRELAFSNLAYLLDATKHPAVKSALEHLGRAKNPETRKEAERILGYQPTPFPPAAAAAQVAILSLGYDLFDLVRNYF